MYFLVAKGTPKPIITEAKDTYSISFYSSDKEAVEYEKKVFEARYARQDADEYAFMTYTFYIVEFSE